MQYLKGNQPPPIVGSALSRVGVQPLRLLQWEEVAASLVKVGEAVLEMVSKARCRVVSRGLRKSRVSERVEQMGECAMEVLLEAA
jgi:hypothetical protein